MAVPSEYFDLVDRKTGSGPFAEIFLYPNDETVDDNWVGSSGPVTNAVVDGVRQLVNACAINWYEVWKLSDSETFPNKDDSSKSAFLDGFREYFNDHQGDYCDFTGLHYGVGGNFDGGGGQNIDDLNEMAFQTNSWTFLGAGSGNTDRVKTFAKQELLHAYIAYNELYDTDLMDGGEHDNQHEHDTGLVYTSGEISPMAITYHDTHAGDGRCANSRSDILGYNRYYTTCSEEAVKRTAEMIFN